MGSEIVDILRSGLALIKDLATGFGEGFGALFWDSAESALTPFATVVFVVLGIGLAITAVTTAIRLVRSKG